MKQFWAIYLVCRLQPRRAPVAILPGSICSPAGPQLQPRRAPVAIPLGSMCILLGCWLGTVIQSSTKWKSRYG